MRKPGASNSGASRTKFTTTPQIIWKMDIAAVPLYAYRAYRVPSLYPGVTWQY